MPDQIDINQLYIMQRVQLLFFLQSCATMAHQPLDSDPLSIFFLIWFFVNLLISAVRRKRGVRELDNDMKQSHTYTLLTASSCSVSSPGFSLCPLFLHLCCLKHISHNVVIILFLFDSATFNHIMKSLGGYACCSDFNMDSLKNRAIGIQHNSLLGSNHRGEGLDT